MLKTFENILNTFSLKKYQKISSKHFSV